jgi:uncharacterized protein with GYD domain
MAIYILLSRLSQQGVQTLQSNPARLQEVNRDVEELGAKVLHQWATLGEFDFVNVVEAPDTATIAKVSVALGARGKKDEPTPDLQPAVFGCTEDDPEPHFLGWLGEVDPDELFASGAAWGVTVRRVPVSG